MGSVATALIEYLRPVRWSLADWIEAHISHDVLVNSAGHGLVQLEPYQRPVVDAMDDPEVELVTEMAVPQSGKSAPWQFALVAHTALYGGPKLVTYQTEQDATDTADDVLTPLFRSLPGFGDEMKRQGTYRRQDGCYHFATASLYMVGAGTPVVSKPCQWVIGDEVDYWQQGSKDTAATNDRAELDNVANLDDRTRTYRGRGRKRILCCTPSTSSGIIYREYAKGTQEVWNLRCVYCGALTPSYAFEALRWVKDDEGEPIEASVRWRCPECKRDHTEAQAHALASKGQYVAGFPERRRHRSFTWSALACPRAIGWGEVAQAITVAGRFPSRHNKIELWSKYKGLAIPRELARDSVTREALTDKFRDKMVKETPTGEVRFCLLTADTQRDGWRWIVRGYGDTGHSWLLGYGNAEEIEALGEEWDREWCGAKPVLAVIDEGGHRKQEVSEWAAGRPMVYRYKGDNRKTAFEFAGRLDFADKDASGDRRKLLIAREISYQAECLGGIYDASPHWWIPSDASDAYLSSLLEVRPPRDTRELDDYTRWKASAKAHYFDCEKQALVGLDFLAWKGRKETFPARVFPPFLAARWKLLRG